MAADAIGDAISGLGLAVPKGASILDMAKLITYNMIAKLPKSTIAFKTSVVDGVVDAVIPLTQSSISGNAFSKSGNSIYLEYDATVIISVSIPATASVTGSTVTVYLRKNGSNLKSASISGQHQNSTTSGTLTMNYSGTAKKGDLFSLYYSGIGHAWNYVGSGTISATATT